jgi:WD40 repeat protein
MTITSEKTRRFLAVGEFNQTETSQETSALISIFDLKNGAYFKRMRQLGCVDIKVEEFTCLCFSNDSKLLVASGFASENIAVVWDWYRDKVIAKCNFAIKISRITFNPKDSYLICTTGEGLWKNWKIDEKTFKPQPPFQGMDRNKNYVDHAWMDEDLVVSVARSGEAFVARSTDFLSVIDSPFGKHHDKSENKLSTLICNNHYIFFGSSEGTIAVWMKALYNNLNAGEVASFEFIRTWSTGRACPITSLALSQNDEVLGFSLNNNDIGVCDVSRVKSEEVEVKVEIFCNGFHKGPITAMDVAIQRPLLVTCCQSDCSIKIWNYTNFRFETGLKLRPEKDSGEMISRCLLSVAFHPSGYFISVGFEDKVKIMHVLYETLIFFKDVNIKYSTCMKFSNGGHLLAASSFKTIYIYTAFTLEQVYAHKVSNSNIIDLSWSSNDLKLVILSADGTISFFENGSSEPDNINRNIDLKSIIFAEGDTAVTCGVDSTVSVLLEQSKNDWTPHTLGVRTGITQIHYFTSYHGTPCFISGCKSGNIQVFGPGPSGSIIEEILAHRGSVVRLRSSYDGRYVFSAGEDGVVFIYHVIEPRENQPQLEKYEAQVKEELLVRNVDEKLADIVLIQKSTLELFKAQREASMQGMDNITQKGENISNQIDSFYEKEKKKIETDLHNECKLLEAQYEKIRDEKTRIEREWVEKFSNLERAYRTAKENAETLYEKKLSIEDEKFRKLDKEKLELKQHYEEEIARYQRQNEEAIENLAVAFKESLKKTQEDYEETRTTAEQLKLNYEERLSMQEDEHEAEIMELKKKYENLVQEQTNENTALRRKNEALLAEQQIFTEEKEELKSNQATLQSDEEALENKIREMEANLRALEQERKDKDDALIEKKNKIDTYKDQIRKLEKQKKVQEAVKKEIDEELHPKDEHISHLQQRMQNVYNECDNERTKNNEFKKNIKERTEAIEELKKAAAEIFSETEKRERSLMAITNDIYNIVNNLEQKTWPSELDKLFEKYVKRELSKVSKKDPECIKEMQEQVNYMNNSINYMTRSQKQVLVRSQSDLKKRTEENSTLINELQELRTIKEKNASRIKELELEINKKTRDLNATKASVNSLASKQPSSSNLPSINPQAAPPPRPQSSKPVGKPVRGRVYKGSPFESRLVNIQEKQRINELEKDLDERKEENFYLKLEINQLREQLEKFES